MTANADFTRFLSTPADDRAGLLLETGQRLGTAPQNVEKDFWVCWTLDVLFNGPASMGPRFLFKGGTSLSKGFGLIERFSEDIDITIFRDDLGEGASVPELEALSGKKRHAKLDSIRDASREFIGTTLLDEVSAALAQVIEAMGLPKTAGRVEIDRDDDSRQTLLVWYPTVSEASDGYIRKAVKIEGGAKSALDPHAEHVIQPYLADDLQSFDLTVPSVRIVDPERTFWDKVVILHGLRQWFEARGVLRAGGQRVSRHYYDAYKLMLAGTGEAALANGRLGRDCVAHARTFFNSPSFGLKLAQPPTFTLRPSGKMLDDLRRDYEAMAGMIFGEVPAFDAVMEVVAGIEDGLNASDPW